MSDRAIAQPSPNYNERRLPVSLLVMHYTGMRSGAEALQRLCDPQFSVSAHYLVEEDGRIFALVDEAHRAWHAGVGHWRGIEDVNSASIGIEIVNPGHEFGYRHFPPAQMEAVRQLSCEILSRHRILPRDVIGHADLAPARKQDPGELFDWQWLAAHGVGLWPEAAHADALRRQPDATSPRQIMQKLVDYGYGLTVADGWNDEAQAVVCAFQRHFRPALVNGEWDAECSQLLDSLLKSG